MPASLVSLPLPEKGYGYMPPKGPQTMVETILLWSVTARHGLLVTLASGCLAFGEEGLEENRIERFCEVDNPSVTE